MLRDAVAFFYIANELISILENAAKMNVGVPSNLQDMIKKLLSMSGEKPNDKTRINPSDVDNEFTDSAIYPMERKDDTDGK